jgi:succinate dehydrogenase / fumarate reductase, membrane anchor subunit
MKQYQTQLGQAKGMGSAKKGTSHWIHQRISAIALVFLGIWFMTQLKDLLYADYKAAVLWASSLKNFLLMILLLAAMLHHAQAGLQVVIEDYVRQESLRFSLICFIKGLSVVLGVAGIGALLQIKFGLSVSIP